MGKLYQYTNIFRHVGLMLQAAGAEWRHVAKMEFWISSVDRGALDPFWIDKFPDEDSRPARHTHIDVSGVTRASFLAYIAD